MTFSFLKTQKTIYYLLIFSCIPIIIKADDSEITPITINENIIDLGSNYIITKIEGTKINNNDYNYLLGIFEASTDSSFSDGFPIAMIKEEVSKNQNSNKHCCKLFKSI